MNWLARAVLLAVPLAFPANVRAGAVTYSFTPIADTSGPISGFNSNIYPSINAGGTVAFQAILHTEGEGILTGSGGPLTTIALAGPGSPFTQFLGFSAPGISADGTVAFQAFQQAGGQGIFRGTGGALTTIADTSGPFSSLRGVAINNSHAVAFGADLRAGGSLILSSSGGLLTTIATTGSLFGSPAINDRGTVAFVTNPVTPGSGLFTGNGGPLTTIATTSVAGPFFQITDPSINNAGTVAFAASLVVGGTLDGSGIFAGSGGPITTILGPNGPLSFPSGTSINNAGTVAFRALLPGGGVGIFTGPDPVADRVIASGDLLFGSQVIALDFGGGQSLNDAGQIAFRAVLADGRTVVVRANPSPAAAVIPEPSTLALFGLGTLGLLGNRWRRRMGRRKGETTPAW
jgi:hypothetical protein